MLFFILITKKAKKITERMKTIVIVSGMIFISASCFIRTVSWIHNIFYMQIEFQFLKQLHFDEMENKQTDCWFKYSPGKLCISSSLRSVPNKNCESIEISLQPRSKHTKSPLYGTRMLGEVHDHRK